MINLKPQVFNKLKEINILGGRVFPSYPESFNSLPCVSYYELTNGENNHADDEEYNSAIEMQIDVWDTATEGTSSVALLVDQKMKELGFKRDFSGDVPQDKPAHKTMRYSIIKEV